MTERLLPAEGIIPAIDLLGGEAVRLRRGNFDDVTWRLPLDPCVERVRSFGAPLVHVVDLDGARSGRINVELMARLVRELAPSLVQVSGGIRSVDDAKALLDLGAERVCAGTAVFGEEGSLDLFAGALGERLVVAIDVRDGRLAVAGWVADTAVEVEQALSSCAKAGVGRLSCTAIRRDGAMEGPDLELLATICSLGPPVLAAGGIRSPQDVKAVLGLGCEAAIVGTALLTGDFFKA